MAHRRTLKLGALFLALLLSCMTSRTFAQDDAYRRLAELATQAVTEHRLDDALAMFREMHAISPSARTLWSLGRVHFERGEYTVALTYLDEALVDARRPLTDASRDEAVALQQRARALTGELQITVTPEDTTVLINDVEQTGRSVRLDPGAHTLRFERSGFESTTRRVEIRGGERTDIRLQMSASTPIAFSARVDLSREAVPQHEINLDIVGATPGLTLHLQRFGDFDLEGTLERVCEAPCTHTLMSGHFASAVSFGDEAPVWAQRVALDSNSRIQLSYTDPGNGPRDVAIAMSVTLLLSAAAIVLGGWALDQGEIGAGVLGIAGGALGVTVGGLGLMIALGDGSTARYAGIQVVPAR